MNPLRSQSLEANTNRNQPLYFQLMEYLRRVGDRLMEYLSSRSEIQVWQRQDRFGNDYWQVYDPHTNRSASFGSEAEVRAWIEELFHQQQFHSVDHSSDYYYHHSNSFR